MKFLYFITLLLLYLVVQYIRNLFLIRRIKDLEELLDSKLHCIFFTDVKICGKYKNKKIEFHSFTRLVFRCSTFYITSDKLPKQKKFNMSYPRYGPRQNVLLRGNKFVYAIDGFGNYKFSKLGKAGFAAILDEFLDVVEKVEHAEEKY
jgi:hypothetical protein